MLQHVATQYKLWGKANAHPMVLKMRPRIRKMASNFDVAHLFLTRNPACVLVFWGCKMIKMPKVAQYEELQRDNFKTGKVLLELLYGVPLNS